DVVLKNLQLKQSALKELDLPVQTIYGCLGKLVLKIPWKNLYSLPVVADVEDLYLLVAPNAAVPYNAEKQEKVDWEAKKGELVKFDEAKKREQEKDKPQADKSFTEKLVAQIINNVQIHIKNVHIRYEDRTTSSIPFSMGITLGTLEVHTTNADWEKAFLSEALSKVFKVAKMDGLAIYMNCNSNLFQSSSTTEYTDLFMKTIATKEAVPENFTYVLGPINSIAKLKLNMEPQLDGFESPKVDLFLEMEKLAVGITKAQYQNLIGLADSMSAMSRGLPYRQYRPYNTPYRKNAKVWWHFSYESILETEVRRRKKCWSWSHMLQHIQLCKEYAAAYQAKISVKTPTAAQIQQCEDLEKKLDLYNILLIRKRVDLEVKISDKQKAEAPKPTSWFGGWFGGNKEDVTKKNESDDILHQFKTAMTPAEKAKLFEAIGYTEGVTDTVLPLDYVAISMEFKLNLLEVCVRNESPVTDPKSPSTFNNQTVLSLQVQGVKCGIDQRPASNGLKVDLNLKEFTVCGYKQEDHLPVLVKSKIGELVDVSLLNVKFEMNPLDKLCDQRVNVSARPLEIAYDAETIIQLVQTFKLPNNTNLSELTDAAADKISNIKERSATGIQYMVEKHTRLEVMISVMPNYVLIPFGGKYIPDKVQVMVISLGKISLKSVPNDDRKDISMMHSLQFTNEDIMKEVMDQAYDKFRLDIENIQILLAKPTDDWKEILLSGRVTSMHILEPIAMNVCADMCVVDDDPRLPKTRITSKFPHIRLSVTEDNVLDALALITSIPFPENEETKPMALNKVNHRKWLKVDSLHRVNPSSDISTKKQSRKPKKPEVKHTDLSQEIIQYTDLEFSFVMNELSVNIYKSNKRDLDSTPTSQYRTPTEEFQDDQSMSVASHRCSVMESVLNESNQELKLSFQIKQLEMGLVQRTYDMKVSLKLGAIVMDEYQHVAGVEKTIRMIETPCYDDLSGYLFSLQYTNANKASPEFTTKYKSVEQLIEINFSVLILRLHQEGLTELLQIANNFQTKLDKVLNPPGKDRIASAGDPVANVLATIAEEPTAVPTSSKAALRNIASLVDSIKIKLIAKMERVAILLENERRAIADLKIENLTAGVVMKTSYTEVSVKLQDIIITDMNPETIHPTIISVIGGNAIACQIVLYNLHETSVYNSDDMKIDVSMGCVKIIFLNWFVNSVLSFLDNFQAAQRAIADASAAAAETAKQNMVDAYANATRMRLNIKIKAPIIIVPVDSKSLEAISIDLGSLSITNNCSEIVGSSTTDSGAAILDEMKLELTDMKISKIVVLSSDGAQRTGDLESDSVYGIRKVNDHSNMLDPTSFVLIIKRNLSSSWYKEIPEMDISGRLKSIILNLMESDYKMLMMILGKNMSEGSDERTAIVQPVTPEKTPSNSASTNTNAQLHVLNEAGITGRDGESSAWDSLAKKTADTKPFGLDIASLKPGSPTQAVNIFLKFAFQMDSIILNLFTDQNEGLATFGIHFLSLKGTKLVDESLSASIVLCDVQLDDTRPDRQNYITKYMKKRDSAAHTHDDTSKPDTSMVDIVVRITQNEMFVNLKVSSFDLILCLEYLMKILQFVSVPEDESAPKAIAPGPATTAPTTAVSKKTVAEPADVSTAPNKQMTVLLRVDQPDIILVEKMDDINCLALILNTQIELRLRIQDDKQNIKGDISDLKFYICEFNPARREATKHFILQPCQIALHGNTPEERGMNISLTTSDIRVNISPAIIELLNKTLTTLTGSEAKNDETLVEMTDYSDLWDVKTYKDADYWFMKVDDAEDVLKTLDLVEVKEHLPEVCIVEVPSIVLVIETGLGYYTYPMLVIETKMNAQVRDWSSEISIESSMTLGMAYYNSSMAVWEPIIEPNEREKSNGLSEYGPWELNFSLKIEKNLDDNTGQVEPKTKISVSSSDTLEMSVTKTCLDVLQDLGNAFSQAIRPEGLHKPDIVAPYIVENDTGFDVTLNLKRGAFFLHTSHLPTGTGNEEVVRSGVVFKSSTTNGTELSPEEVTTCKISPGAKAYLQGKKEDSMNAISAFSSLNKDSQNDMFLHVQIGDIDKEVTLPIHKADRRYFPLYRDTKQEPWGILSNVKTEYGSKVITISGVLKIQNHFSTTVNVFRMRDGIFHDIGQVAPGSSYNVPLHALYAAHKELYFSIAGYKTSVQGINWKDCPSDFKYTKYLQCDPMDTFEPFYITAIREREEVYHEVTSKVTMLSACYVVHLKPPLYLRNALPIDISISVAGCSVANTDDVTEAKEVSQVDGSPVKKNVGLELSPRDDFLDYGEKVVKPGDVLHLPTVKTTVKEGDNKSYLVARLIQYLEKDWSCTTEIPSVPSEFAVWTFSSYDSVDKMTLDLGVKFENRYGSLQLTVYCPYWMINKTGLLLSYRKSRKTEKHELSGSPAKASDENVNVLYHPPEWEGPILFSFREKVFFGKKRASVRVESGEWSDRFALDAAGSTGVVECKSNEMIYEIAVHNTLTHNSLTKQIMFIPMYVMMNKAPFTIEVQEDRRTWRSVD
ncbi:vacuolar protein sorting-associated protein 13-like, partial [Bradysia coprophila]|uniref:vacuolar protein sorting-associated protein 13-like n=1 Tax=Bradysia coprophila TaxID=38358 RepID=UPI00187D9050